MNKLIIAFLPLMLFAQVLTAQTGHKENDTLINYIDINMKKQGKWVKRYDNGQIRYKGFFDNDQPVGTFFYFHRDGSLKSVLDYTHKDYIAAELYWPNGKTAAVGKYNHNQERNGYWRMFFENGVLSIEANYVNNILHGFVRMFYPSGGKLVDFNFNMGIQEGAYSKYFENGVLMETGNYKNNKREGHFKIYDSAKNLSEDGPYVKGMRHGIWYFYNNGKISDTVNYIYDTPDNFLEVGKELQEKIEWAKQNQDKFKNPEDYLDNPIDFFKP